MGQGQQVGQADIDLLRLTRLLGLNDETYLGIKKYLEQAGIPYDDPVAAKLIASTVSILRENYATRRDEFLNLAAVPVGHVVGLIMSGLQDEVSGGVPLVSRRPQ